MPSLSCRVEHQVEDFKSAFKHVLPLRVLRTILRREGPVRRRRPKLGTPELLMGLVFHFLHGTGTLGESTGLLFHRKLAESTVSERRQNLPWKVFTSIMEAALSPKAEPKKHAEAFYKGLRLVAIDGTQFSVSNTPQILGSLSKAASRRMKAAFAKVGMALLAELGVHNPLAAAIGKEGESELCLARQLLESLPARSVLIADRLYGVGAFLSLLAERLARVPGHYLVRVRSNLKARMIQRCGDGSALVEVRPSAGKTKLLVREVRGRLRRPGGRWIEVRFWTSLLDWKEHPARELLGLYVRRWEQEMMYKQLKVEMRQAGLLKSHTVETAAQEIAALVLAQAILAEQRMRIARCAKDQVLRISFGKTLALVRSLWVVLAAGEGVLSPQQTTAMTRRVMTLIAQTALPPRRRRSCPRAVRQPVGSWPRLTKNTYSEGATQYQPTPING